MRNQGKGGEEEKIKLRKLKNSSIKIDFCLIYSMFCAFSNHSNLIFFCELKPPAKFQNPRTTPSGRKVCHPEKKEEK